ncbi:16496_t:CDS:2, partial [Dentiscutata heterogama]
KEYPFDDETASNFANIQEYWDFSLDKVFSMAQISDDHRHKQPNSCDIEQKSSDVIDLESSDVIELETNKNEEMIIEDDFESSKAVLKEWSESLISEEESIKEHENLFGTDELEETEETEVWIVREYRKTILEKERTKKLEETKRLLELEERKKEITGVNEIDDVGGLDEKARYKAQKLHELKRTKRDKEHK